jgi:nicotinamide phosphoribosyltransferase
MTPILFKDFYKVDHRRQYPEGTEFVYSNLTPRISRLEGIDRVVVFGIQAFVKRYLIRDFNEKFFQKPKSEVVGKYKRRLDTSLGKDSVPVEHIEDLHDLGYLPVCLKALPEGTLCPLKTPVLTITNTDPRFYWLPNFLETLLSCELWHPMTAATIARAYRETLDQFAGMTSDIPDFVQWQGHDFSMRGSTSVVSAMASGAGHLLSFTGTDTIPAIDYLEEFYGADSEKELVGGSVPATEHAVMCLGGKETEAETFRRLIECVYPTGIVSIVSDTWDFWKVLTELLPAMKDKIMARNGKVVIRPDSGDPVKILCGDWTAEPKSPAYKGAVQLLWELFGGTRNSKGFMQLDPHIGVIYGDSITLDRCQKICSQLMHKGFASTNVVFGIGSYTYQHVTRDSLGFAMKATYGVINGAPCDLYKAPATDSGTKNSAKGLLRVNADLSLSEQVTREEEAGGELRVVFKNGVQFHEQTLTTIRQRLKQ